ncbi:MAG: AAA family ATPase [Lachnospiraceae bacterium]|nr:AAA family ATPase [Lachnospiraceae bacterium]
MKKTLPIGLDDFRIMREHNKYYVDKTRMIKDFIEYENIVTLITRPRRFGKTLNMTMLRDFFDISQDSKDIFYGLAIMDTVYATQINSAPVIYLTLKNCTGKSVESLEASIAEEIRKEYIKYESVFVDVDQQKSVYVRYFETLKMLENENITETRLKNSIAYLMEALHVRYGIRPIVLIDEYDNPIISAHKGGFREEFSDFYSTFLTVLLKGNSHLGQALLTGIQRVAKESIFSRLNNLVVYNVLSKRYSDYFGLTGKETEKLLDYYGVELNDAVRGFYDGYSFSGTEIYNPWSILNYVSEEELKPYWVNTSTNALITESLLSADYDFHKGFEELIVNGQTEIAANLEASFVELPKTETLWGLLVNAGYLTIINADFEYELFTVRIPNREVMTELRKIVSDYTKLSAQSLQKMLKS